MSDDQGKAAGEKPVRLVSKPAGNPLGFSLEFRENAALVTLRDRLVPGGIRVERLELEVPDVRFPFDVAGGAEQFRHRRCRLRTLVGSIDQAEVARVLGTLLDPARYGLSDLQLEIADGQGVLTGTWKTGESRAPFSLRFVAEAGDALDVLVQIYDLRLFGPLPLPASALVGQLGRAMQAVRARMEDGGVLALRPVQDLMRWLLPVHGWKVPDIEGLRLDRVDLSGGRIRLVTARYPDELPEASDRQASTPLHPSLERRVLVFKEGIQAYHEGEQALAEGRLEDARKLFLGKDGIEPAHPHAARRMLEIGVVRPERFDEVEDLIGDLLSADADFLPALFARAVVCERRGGDRDRARAGQAFRRIGDLAAGNRELPDAVLAHTKAGQLFEQVDAGEAISSYERVLELDPDHLRAMRILTRLYEENSQWYRALRMNLRCARRLDDPVEISACHLRMGNVFLERFDDLERARKHFSSALTHDPNNLDALSSQALVYQRQEQPTRAAKLLLRLLELADPEQHGQRILDTRLRLGRLWEEDLDDPSTALLHYERVLEKQPEHLEALHKVGLIATTQERWEQAAGAFSRLLEMEAGGRAIPDEVIRSSCLALGRIYSARPDGRSEARAHLRRAADLGEGDLSVWLALEKIERDEQAWPGLVEVLERKADLVPDEETMLASVLEAARICDRRLGDRSRAEVLYRRALGLQPSSTEALEGLTFVLRDEGRFEELEAVLVEAAEAEPEVRRAAALWDLVGALRNEQLGDPSGSLKALERAVELDPGNPVTVERLLASYRAQHDLEAFVDLTGRIREGTLATEKLVDVWLERAKILEEQLDRRDEAVQSYQHALQLEPDLLQAHRALADLYFEQDMWAEAREAIDHVLRTAGDAGLSGPGGTDLYRRLAEVEIRLGNRAAAIDQLRQVLSRYHDDEESADRLSRLLREEERWEELAAFYAQRAERATSEQAAALHTAAATIWWEKLKKLEPAAAQYQLAVESAPHSDAAPARLASLQRVYVGLGRWMDVVGVLELRVAFCRREEKAPMYLAMAAILSSRIDDPEAAAVCWTRALQVDPGHRPSLLMLARHRFEQGSYEEALDLGRRALADDGTGPVLPAERRAAVALDAARAAWVLERFDDAVHMYQEHMDAYAPRQYSGVDPEALERLELLLRKQRHYQDLALLYRRWLGSGATPDRRPGLRRTLALLLFEHLDQPDEAIEVLSAHVNDKPDDQPAVADLLDMLRASSRWEHLVHLLREQWNQAPNDQARIDRLEELADTLQRRLHQPEAAIVHWQTLMDEGHSTAAERLAGLYRQEGMHRELAELLRARAEACEQPEEASQVFCELGKLAAENLGDVEMALDAYRQAYNRVASRDNQETILTLLREKGTPSALAEFLLECAEEEEDPQRQRILLLEHAELCLTRLQQRPDAIRSLRRAVELEADEASLHRCQALYEEDGDWEGVADMQELLVDLADESSTAARRLHRLGRIFLLNLQAPERGKAAFERAAQLDPSWQAPLVDLGRILTEEEDWEGLLALKLRLAKVTADEDDRAERLHEAAGLAFGPIGDTARGVELLQQAVEASGDPIPWLAELADRCEQTGRYTEAADAIERMVSEEREISDTTETPAAMFRRLAELRSKADEDDAAIAAFEQALRLEPSDEVTAERLETIYRRQKRHTDLAMMLEDLAGRKNRSQAADTWLAAAKSWMEAGDSKSAEFALDKALAVQPDHQEASGMTLELLGQREAWDEMLRVLQGLPEELFGVVEVELAVRACFEHMLTASDMDAQRLACRMMLRLDPDNIAALDRLATLLQEGGDSDEAETVLRRMDQHADALSEERRYELDFTLASIDFSRGHLEEAERRLKACIQTRPSDPAPREFLHKIYTGGKRFADQVALLLDEAARCADTAERVDKLCRAADLREAGLGDPRGAAELLAQVVEEDPERLDTWRKLVRLHRLLDDPRKQREALLRVAELGDEEETIEALRKATRLAHEVLSDPEAARMGWACLLEKLPEDGEALDGIIEIERREGLDQALENHLAQRLAVTGDPALQASLLRERADLFLDRLDSPGQAMEALERLEKLLPRDGTVLAQLASLYQSTERWTGLSRVLGRQIELAGSERDRARLWLQLASVRQDRLDDPAGAVDALRKAVSNDPEDRAPLDQLRRLAAANRDDALHIEALEALAVRTDEVEEECDLRRAAGLLRWSSGQKEEARKAFGRVLVINPDDLVARRFLARLQFEQDPAGAVEHIRWLLDHPDALRPEDTRLLRRQLVEALADADPAERVEALESLLEAVPGDLMAARQLADLYRETGSHRSLADLLARMGDMVEEGTGADLWIQRGEILLREGDHAAAAQALQRALAIDGEHRYEVAVRLARIQLHKLDDKPAAVASLEEALELQPQDTATLQQLSELYGLMEDWQRAAEMTARLIDQTEEEQRPELQLRLGDIRLAQGMIEEARHAFELAIELDPALRTAYQRLEEVIPEQDDAQRAAFYLRWARSPAAGSRRVVLFADAARLLGRMDENGQATEALDEALRLDPAGVVAHIRQLLDHPEELAEADVCVLRRQLVAALADADPAERIEALEQLLEEAPDDLKATRDLADLYRETGRERELADLLARMGDMVEQGTGADLWIQRGEILLREGDHPAAAQALERALAIQGTHQVEVGLQLAGIQLRELEDRPAAAASLERVLELDPQNAAALQQLSDLYWSTEDWQRAADATALLIAQVDTTHQPGLYMRLGDIRQKLGMNDDARRAFEKAIALDPAYQTAYQRLEEVLPEDDEDQRADLYLRWARGPAAGSRRVALFADAARLLERGGETGEAIEALEEALQLDPANPGVCESLAPLLAREERWEDLLEVLQRRIEMAEDGERRFALAFEMGELCKEHLDDPERAAVHFEQCLAVDPGNPAALEELADIHYARQNWVRALQLYDELGERGLAAKKFVVAFRRGEMAEVIEDDGAAIEHHRRSVHLNPTFIPARQSLIKLLGRQDRYPELAEEIEGLLDVLPEEGFEDMALDLWRQLGRTYLRLLDFDQAAQWFGRVLEREPDNLEAMRVRKNLAANKGNWKDAVSLARRELEMAPDAPDAADRFETLGDMVLEGTDDPAGAADAYREALARDPHDPGRVRWKLWDILRQGTDWKALRELGAKLLEEDLDQEAELSVRRTLGDACQQAGDDAGALVHLKHVLSHEGGDAGFLERVADLARTQEQWSLYASLSGQALEARLAEGLDAEDALEGYLRLAGVYQEKLGDVTRAAASIRRALELHPRDPELLRRLGNLYSGDFETYREAIEVFRELIGMDPTDGELYRYLARLEAARGDADRTSCYYAGLRFLTPMDDEARKYLSYAGRTVMPDRGLGRAEWDDIILHPGADCLLQRVMAVLAPYLEQLFPADLERFGVQGDHMVGAGFHPEVAQAAEQARELVAGRAFSVFVIDQQEAYQAWLESGGTPSIILSGAVVKRSTPEELAFFIAREVAKVATGFVLPAKLSRSDLLQLFGLLCKIARPDTEAPVTLPATAPQYLAAIKEMVPGEVLEMVLPLIRRYALEPRAHDLDRWHVGIKRTADRLGLLCCGELNAALSVMTRESDAAGGRDLAFIPDRANLLARDADMMTLFRFSFSEPFLRLRRELGVVVKSG